MFIVLFILILNVQKKDKDEIRNLISKWGSKYSGFTRLINSYGQLDVIFDDYSKFRVVNVSEYQRGLRNHMVIIDNTISDYDCESLILPKIISYNRHDNVIPENKEIYVDLS